MTTPTITVYDLGDPATITLQVSVGGVATDGSAVSLTLRGPDDVDTVVPVVRTGVGAYQAIVVPLLSGDYYYRWLVTGTGAGAQEGAFTVRRPFTAATAARGRARARLAQMVAAASRPTLSDENLDDLLDDYRTVDGHGNLVTDPGYVPTYALNAAAAEGWRRKAAMVAGDFTFQADDASYSKGDVLANMEKMVQMYAAKDVGTLSFGVRDRRYDTDRLMPNG